jgi:polar amino acid transport system substrate-binding protein
MVFTTKTELFTALKAKQVDAVLLDTSIELAQAPTQNATVVAQFDTGDQFAALLPKGSVNTKLVNAALATLKSNGTLDKLVTTWLLPAFKGDPTKVPVIAAS